VGLDTTIDLGWNGRRFTRFAVQNRLFAFEYESLAEPIDGIHMHAKCLGNLVACELAADAVGVAEEQNACMANFAHGC